MKFKPFSQYCYGVCVYVWYVGMYGCVYRCVFIVNTSDCLYLQVTDETKDSWETVVWL